MRGVRFTFLVQKCEVTIEDIFVYFEEMIFHMTDIGFQKRSLEPHRWWVTLTYGIKDNLMWADGKTKINLHLLVHKVLNSFRLSSWMGSEPFPHFIHGAHPSVNAK